jgi:tetratricopeptide (TPR) repeat protein
MFLIIPFSLALAALLVVLVIVWRKRTYLRKLTPEAHVFGETALHDFAPEMMGWIESVPWRRFVHNLLVEIEKVLRKARLLMSSLDQASDKVIRKVRTVHQATAKQHEEIVAQRQEAQEAVEKQAEEPDDLDMDDPEQLRQEEQRLIVAIAQSPKDIEQYIQLARVYMRLGNFSDAIEALQAASRIEPENEGVLKRLERARKLREKQVEQASAESV